MLRKSLCLLLIVVTLAACSPAPIPSPATPPTPTAEPADSPSGDPADTQEALRNRWHTPLVAAFYPWLVCEAARANIAGGETGDEREQAAISIATLANAGLEVLNTWDPPEEFASDRSQSLAHLSVLIETAGRWYNEEVDGETFMNDLATLCQSIQTSLQETTAAAREEGLSDETLQGILERFQQSLAQP